MFKKCAKFCQPMKDFATHFALCDGQQCHQIWVWDNNMKAWSMLITMPRLGRMSSAMSGVTMILEMSKSLLQLLGDLQGDQSKE
jgi:hypothetical protein